MPFFGRAVQAPIVSVPISVPVAASADPIPKGQAVVTAGVVQHYGCYQFANYDCTKWNEVQPECSRNGGSSDIYWDCDGYSQMWMINPSNGRQSGGYLCLTRVGMTAEGHVRQVFFQASRDECAYDGGGGGIAPALRFFRAAGGR